MRIPSGPYLEQRPATAPLLPQVGEARFLSSRPVCNVWCFLLFTDCYANLCFVYQQILTLCPNPCLLVPCLNKVIVSIHRVICLIYIYRSICLASKLIHRSLCLRYGSALEPVHKFSHLQVYGMNSVARLNFWLSLFFIHRMMSRDLLSSRSQAQVVSACFWFSQSACWYWAEWAAIRPATHYCWH